MLPSTVQFFIALIGCALNERMQRKLDYTQEEVRALKELFQAVTGKKRLPFTDAQRRRLATKGQALTPAERKECCNIVKPETMLAWFRKLVAQKYDSSNPTVRRSGRPRKSDEVRALVIDIARANPGCGYTKTRDALRNGLGIEIGRTTVADILREAGIEPAPERDKKRTWKQFMRSHWESLYACDFFSVEVLGWFGPVRHMVLFVLELETRKVEIAGIRVDPDGEWMKQMARNLTDPIDGFLRNASYLVHDRDPLFTNAFREILISSGVKTVKIPAQSPNCSPHAERFVRSIKYECLNHFVCFGEQHLRYVIGRYLDQYHHEHFHQGLGGALVSGATPAVNENAAIQCRMFGDDSMENCSLRLSRYMAGAKPLGGGAWKPFE